MIMVRGKTKLQLDSTGKRIPKAGPAGDISIVSAAPTTSALCRNSLSMAGIEAGDISIVSAAPTTSALCRNPLSMAGIEKVESPGDPGVVSAGSTTERGNPGDAGVVSAGSRPGMCRPTQPQAKNEEFAPKMDWSEFEHEPLKSINLIEIREQRSIEDVEKLALSLIKYKHLLSNGELNFRTNPNVKHDTQCTVTTTHRTTPSSPQGEPDATPRRLRSI